MLSPIAKPLNTTASCAFRWRNTSMPHSKSTKNWNPWRLKTRTRKMNAL